MIRRMVFPPKRAPEERGRLLMTLQKQTFPGVSGQSRCIGRERGVTRSSYSTGGHPITSRNACQQVPGIFSAFRRQAAQLDT